MDRSTLKTYLFLTIPLVAGKILDLYSTKLGLSIGLHEANPFMANMMTTIGKYNTYALSLFAMAFIGIAMNISWLLCKKLEANIKVPWAAKIVFVIIYTITVYPNFHAFLWNMSLVNGVA